MKPKLLTDHEYRAKAMLLGMKYNSAYHVIIKNRQGDAMAWGTDVLRLHPDTLVPFEVRDWTKWSQRNWSEKVDDTG